MVKLERPPYILTHSGDAQGCGHHRVMRPLDIMAKHGYAAGRNEFQFLQLQFLAALKPDVIVWQRQGEKHQIEMIKKYREILPRSFFVYELDDILSAVPEKSWHKPFMPPNIDDGVQAGASLCDVITVSTKDLATHMKTLCPDKEIRVVPNMLSLDDFENAHKIRTAPKRPDQVKKKFRIGWGGGAGHGGDFDQIQEAFKHFKGKVEWIFLGFKPEIPKDVDTIFAGAATPAGYTAALANLDCDLAIAPLEDNQFNRCKSNLRMIENGACSYATIASPVTPYLEGNPPVFAYCSQPSEWIKEIEKFMALTPSQRSDHGRKMHSWARNHYCLDDKIKERTEAWLPTGTKAFVPHLNDGTATGVCIVSDAVELKLDGEFVRKKTIAEACREGRADILYIRDTITAPTDLLDRIKRATASLRQAATISFLSNDGGSVGFPKIQSFTALDPGTASGIDKAAIEIVEEDLGKQFQNLGYASGACLYIRRAALDLAGFPDFEAIPDPEIAIIEWSATAAARGFQNLLYFGAYLFSDRQKTIVQSEVEPIVMRMGMRWPQPKCETDKITELREKLDLRFHRNHYRGLPPTNRTDYSYWAAMYDTPSEKLMTEMAEWMAKRPALHVVTACYGSNKADEMSYFDKLKKASESDADWVICSDYKTKIEDYFTAYLSDTIEKNPDAVVMYCDHDRQAPNGTRMDHDFKPDFDHHLLLCRDYVTQAVAFKRETLAELLEDADGEFEADCLLYRLVLKVIRACEANIDHLGSSERIAHIQRICAHLTIVDPTVLRKRAVEKSKIAHKHVELLGWTTASVKPHPVLLDAAELRYFDKDIAKWGQPPLVSIIIPCKNKVEMLAPCLNTVLSMTTYPNFRILVVDNGSDRQEILDYQATITDPRVKLIKWPEPYNWSKLNNFAVDQFEPVDGELLCFLNDDTRVLAPHWLDEMVAAALLPNVAGVGARLLYPQGAVQHIGVISNKHCNGHLHKGMASHLPGYHGIAFLSHEAVCVTGACMVIKRSTFEDIGRFPEIFSHNYNDVAFCLNARRKGYIHIVAIRAELQHFESVTRPYANSEIGMKFLKSEGAMMADLYKERDPYWNPNLSLFGVNNGMQIVGLNCDTPVWPTLRWVWRDLDKQFERVLLLGREGTVLDEIRNADSVYELAIQGYETRFIKPPIENCKPFDIRDIKRMREDLAELGIDRIIIGSIGDAAPVHLAALTSLGLKIEYRPSDAESICPRHDLKPNGQFCDQGWIKGACQACIDQYSSPHGPVSTMGWLAEWLRFLSNENVTADMGGLEIPEYGKAIEQVYGAGGLIAGIAGGKKEEDKIKEAKDTVQ